MNARQQATTKMILSTEAVLAEGETVYKDHEAFSEGVEELTEVVLEVNETSQKQIGRSGAANAKSIAKFLVGEIAFEISAAGFACASKAGNSDLAARLSYSRSAITKGGDLKVLARCQDILAAATAVSDALGKYGVTAAKLATLKKRIEVFRKALTGPREKQADSSAATRALPKLLSQATAILTQQLDKLVVQFREANPEFVDKYFTARAVVDPGSRGAAKEASSSTAGNSSGSTTGTPTSRAA